jgi:hypothetical protein
VWSMRLPPHFGAVSRSGPAEQRHQPSSNHQAALCGYARFAQPRQGKWRAYLPRWHTVTWTVLTTHIERIPRAESVALTRPETARMLGGCESLSLGRVA